ncbi:MAG: hypothetical protein ACOC1F_01590 [Myxococcota bacterium]
MKEQETTKKSQASRTFAERVAHRANYMAWHRTTRTALERWLRRTRPQPVPPIGEEAAAAVTVTAVSVDDAAAGAAVRAGANFRHRLGREGVVACVAGVMAGATAEAVRSWSSVQTGRLPPVELARRMATSGARTGAGMGARAAGALGLQELAKATASRFGSVGLRRALGSNVASGVAFAVVEQAVDTVHYARGAIDRSEYGARSCQTAGATSGALSGIALGAAVGSAIPIVGTTVGGAIGGVLGGAAGSFGGRRMGDAVFAAQPRDLIDDVSAEPLDEADADAV